MAPPVGWTLEEVISFGWTSAKAERGKHHDVHRHLARYVRPQHDEFFNDGRKESTRPAIELLWDDTPIKANDAWARGVNSMTHNQATDWFFYRDSDKLTMLDAEVRDWYGLVNDDLKTECRQSSLYASLLNRLKDVGTYGFGAAYSYEGDNKGHLTFEYVPAPECYFRLNRRGLPVEFIRPLNLTVSEIRERKIEISRCSQAVRDADNTKNNDARFQFIHFVTEREELDGYSLSDKHPVVGFYFEVNVKTIVGEHGYWDFPYHVLCWDPQPQSSYPVGIGYITLPEIRNLNAQRKKFDRVLDNESDSPILATNQDEGKEQARPQAGEMIYGGMSGNGQRLYDPLYRANVGSRTLTEEIRDGRNAILEAWHNNLMLMVSNGQMTALEVASRDEKIIQAMGPFIIPMFTDLKAIMDRIFHARMRAGAYDPLPRAFGPKTTAEIEFTGILAKAHKKLTATNITMFISEALATIGAYDPQELKASIDSGIAMRELGEARALPAGLVRSADERDKALQAAQQQEMQRMALENAGKLGQAAKAGAQAVNELGGAGGGNGASGIALAP